MKKKNLGSLGCFGRDFIFPDWGNPGAHEEI